MECEQAVALIPSLLEHRLGPEDRARLEAHLRDCPACRGAVDAFPPEEADLRRAYGTCAASANGVAERVIGRLPGRPRSVRQRLTAVLVLTAACAACFIALAHLDLRPRPTVRVEPAPRSSTAHASEAGARMLPRPRTATQRPPTLAIGGEAHTGPTERRRLALPDGSLVYLNQGTTAQLEADRRLVLSAGEVFVAVRPAERPFTVRTPDREIVALGTRFAVRTQARHTDVRVTQGRVKVNGLADEIEAGQELDASGKITPAPRVSRTLDWTRELMAADSPLVPASKYQGGAIVAIDPEGQETRLSLRKYHVDVHIEDGFARTTIDQTYFNESPWSLEGTFYFPLPPDASVSRLAMYVASGQECVLMEGGIVERDYARQVFEQITAARRDPALLEWVDGHTFRMRIFPLEGRQEKRVILSYTQRLPSLYGRTSYRFPLGHTLGIVRDWSFHAFVKGGADLTWGSESHDLQARKAGRDLVLDTAARQVGLDRDVAFDLYSAAPPEVARFSSAELDGARYLMVRYRPTLTAARSPGPRTWVFLVESSGERTPLLARAQIEIVRGLLANAEPGDTFAVIAASTRPRVWASATEGVPVTPENIDAAIAFLEQTHLVGALDLGKALAATEPFVRSAHGTWLVHIGSGDAGIGERRPEALAARVPAGVRYVGVPVGRRWSRPFMERVAERTGGYVAPINPDEPLAYRTFELASTLQAPRLLNVRVEDAAGRVRFLNYAHTVAQGEELCAVARLDGPNHEWPHELRITGTVDGKDFRRTLIVKDFAPRANYLPRTWARLEIDRLVDDGADRNHDAIVALGKAMYIMTPFTSLLVLENEEMYRRFNVDRGRTDHWALYPAPPRIPVVYEPEGGQNMPPNRNPVARGRRVEDVLETILLRVPPPVLRSDVPVAGARVQDHLTARDAYCRKEPADRRVPIFMAGLGSPGPGLVLDGVTVRALEDKFQGANAGGDEPVVGRGTPDVQEQIADIDEFKDPDLLRRFRRLQQKLARPIDLPKGIDKDTSLKDALEYLCDRYDLTVFIDTQAFRDDLQIQEIGECPVHLPRMRGVTLDTVLRLLIVQAGGAYLIRRDYVEMTTPGRREAELKRQVRAGPLGEIIRRDGTLQIGGGLIGAHFLPELDPDEEPRVPTAGWRGRLPAARSNAFTLPPLPALPTLPNTLTGPAGDLWSPTATPGRLLGPGPLPLRRLVCEEELHALAARLLSDDPPSEPDLLYRQPTFSGDRRVFTDLIAFAPGLNTVRADIFAAVEAEAAPRPESLRGRVDPAARRLIDRARGAGWQAVRIAGRVPFMVTCDGRGRFAYDRILPCGLREQVICDGESLLHLYPELGLGARRRFSRFHQADFARLVPWTLPAADDLARGADVRCLDAHTVAVVRHPIGKGLPDLRLVFGKDGRMTERQLVRSGTIVYRECYGRDGSVRLLDTRGKEIARLDRRTERAPQPDLELDTRGVVLLPLPFRTLRSDDPAARLSRALGQNGPDEPPAVFAAHTNVLGRRRLGYYTILSAMESAAIDPPAPRPDRRSAVVHDLRWGVEHLSDRYDLTVLLGVGPAERSAAKAGLLFAVLSVGGFANPVLLTACLEEAPFDEAARLFPREPVARYLSLIHRTPLLRSVPLRPGAGGNGLVRSLLDLRVLQERKLRGLPGTDVPERLRTAGTRPPDLVAWASLSLLNDAVPDATPNWAPFAQVPGLSYAARYEAARALAQAGRVAAARDQFLTLYADTLATGELPRIDRNFRDALTGNGTEPQGWPAFLRRTAEKLSAANERPAVVLLAWQCWQLGDLDGARTVLALALGGSENDPERLRTSLAAVEYLWQTHQVRQAHELVETLLMRPTFARRPILWRLGAALARQRRLTGRAGECLERAVSLEYEQLPGVLDLAAVRNDFGLLLAYYQERSNAFAVLKQAAPADLVERVMVAADRWRSLDPDNPAICLLTAQILYKLGAHDLAWEYLNTPVAIFLPDAEAWLDFARALVRQGDVELADRAYEQAYEAEPDNAQTLWDRAQNLEQAGQLAKARTLYRRLAQRKVERRFRPIQEEARRRAQLP